MKGKLTKTEQKLLGRLKNRKYGFAEWGQYYGKQYGKRERQALRRLEEKGLIVFYDKERDGYKINRAGRYYHTYTVQYITKGR